jgi:hypothetical protein
LEEPVNADALRRDVLIGFEYSYLHDSWVNPLSEALADVTAQEAVWRPAPDAKCIGEIVLHMSVWNENGVWLLHGNLPRKPPEGDWPLLPMPLEEAGWEGIQTRLWNSLAAIRAALEQISIPALLTHPEGAYGSPLAEILCRFAHNAYHIGQITKMRECLPTPSS